MALFRTKLVGKSRTALFDVGGFKPITKWVELRNVEANATFVLPANVALTGQVAVANNSAVEQAAVTIGTAAAGTQVSAGAAVAAGLASLVVATRLQAAAADRTIYVESVAWQAGTSVFVEAVELPMAADTTAKS